jgi:hypothetical protein
MGGNANRGAQEAQRGQNKNRGRDNYTHNRGGHAYSYSRLDATKLVHVLNKLETIMLVAIKQLMAIIITEEL